MSGRNIGSGSTKDLIDSYSELVEITGGMRESAYEVVAANAKVIKELPELLGRLDDKKVVEEDVNKLINVAKTIGRDTDSFMEELKGIDDKFIPIKDKGARSAKVASKNYASVLSISTRYHDVTSRLTETTSELVNDFTDMCIDLGITNEDGDDDV